MRRMRSLQSIALVACAAAVAACAGRGGENVPPEAATRKAEANKAAAVPKTTGAAGAPSGSRSETRITLDPLVGRWTIDRAASIGGDDPSRGPEETLGESLLFLRDGVILVAESQRRGTWKRMTGGLKITLDPPPTSLTALFDCTVTASELRLSGAKGVDLLYRRDTILAPREGKGVPTVVAPGAT